MTLRQRMQSLACNVFLSDLTLEFDAVGVVLGHGFHPWKARRPRSIPNPRPVHCQGRTPKSLEGVPGVAKVTVSYKDKTAIVTYDENKADVQELTGATTNAGYPSAPKS